MRTSTYHKIEIYRVMEWKPEHIGDDYKFKELKHFFALYFIARLKDCFGNHLSMRMLHKFAEEKEESFYETLRAWNEGKSKKQFTTGGMK